MVSDPIADFLIQIKNASMAERERIVVEHSKIKEAMGKLLVKSGYLSKIEIETKDKVKKFLICFLAYSNKEPKLNEVKRISKPSKRVYVGKDRIPRILGGLGIAVISTPKGLMTDREAREKKLGGELICAIT